MKIGYIHDYKAIQTSRRRVQHSSPIENMCKQDLSTSSTDLPLPASWMTEIRKHCTCRSYRKHSSVSGTDNDAPEKIVSQLHRIFRDLCSQHSFGLRCPTGSERRYVIRNSTPAKLRDGRNPEFEVRCEEVVEYCVSKENLQRLSEGEMTMEELVKSAGVQRKRTKRVSGAQGIADRSSARRDDGNDWSRGYYSIPGIVVVAGEYANDWHAAYTSVSRIIGAMIGQKEYTTTANDFRAQCSGCGLPRKIEQQRGNLCFELPLLRGMESRIQTTESGFDCAFCLACYDAKEELFEHHAEYHPDSFFHGLEKGSCGNCDEVFYDREWLEEHCSLVHGYSDATLSLWH